MAFPENGPVSGMVERLETGRPWSGEPELKYTGGPRVSNPDRQWVRAALECAVLFGGPRPHGPPYFLSHMPAILPISPTGAFVLWLTPPLVRRKTSP